MIEQEPQPTPETVDRLEVIMQLSGMRRAALAGAKKAKERKRTLTAQYLTGRADAYREAADLMKTFIRVGVKGPICGPKET